MIKKEEIKVGLEFVLPYSDFKDEEDEKEYIHRLVRHGFDGVCHWKNVFFTKIQFDGEERTIETIKRPVFRVICKGGLHDTDERDFVFVKNIEKTGGVFWEEGNLNIDLSFVEKFGEKVVKKQKRKRRNKERREMYDIPYLGKYSIRLDSGIVDDLSSFAKIKKEDDKDTDCSLGFLNRAIDSLFEETLCNNNNLSKCIESIYQYLKDVHPKEGEPEADSKKEDVDRFKEITDKMFETFKAKNHDYGSSFSNLFKECGMAYAYGHMAEKLERVKSLMKDEANVKGEGMKDSLLDLANYAILTVMEIEKGGE